MFSFSAHCPYDSPQILLPSLNRMASHLKSSSTVSPRLILESPPTSLHAKLHSKIFFHPVYVEDIQHIHTTPVAVYLWMLRVPAVVARPINYISVVSEYIENSMYFQLSWCYSKTFTNRDYLLKMLINCGKYLVTNLVEDAIFV